MLLTKISPTFSTASSVYEILSYSEIPLLPAKDSKNKEHKFNSIADIQFILQKSKDETLRKNAYLSLNNSYIKFENSLAKTMYQNFYLLNEIAKIYKFEDYIDKVCFSDEVDKDFIKHVYSQVETYKNKLIKNITLLKINIEKKWLEISKWLLEISHMIFILNLNKLIEPEEAEQIILESLAIFGEEYVSVLKKAFNQI